MNLCSFAKLEIGEWGRNGKRQDGHDLPDATKMVQIENSINMNSIVRAE